MNTKGLAFKDPFFHDRIERYGVSQYHDTPNATPDSAHRTHHAAALTLAVGKPSRPFLYCQ